MNEFPSFLELPLDARYGPAKRISNAAAMQMIANALDALEAEKLPEQPSRPKPERLPWIAVAASLVFGLVGTAAAANWYMQRQRAATNAHSLPTAAPKPRAKSTTPGPPPAEPELERQAQTAAHPPAPKAKRVIAASPRDLLERANHQRTLGQWHKAARTYSRVYHHDSDSLSGYVARYAAASIRLEQLDDAIGAIRLLRQARRARPHGSLDLELRHALAEASRKLGDREAEKAELESLLEAYPTSPQAVAAKKRLTELARNY